LLRVTKENPAVNETSQSEIFELIAKSAKVDVATDHVLHRLAVVSGGER